MTILGLQSAVHSVAHPQVTQMIEQIAGYQIVDAMCFHNKQLSRFDGRATVSSQVNEPASAGSYSSCRQWDAGLAPQDGKRVPVMLARRAPETRWGNPNLRIS
jgi:murein endopeptidase